MIDVLLYAATIQVEGHEMRWVSGIEICGVEGSAFDDLFDGHGEILQYKTTANVRT